MIKKAIIFGIAMLIFGMTFASCNNEGPASDSPAASGQSANNASCTKSDV